MITVAQLIGQLKTMPSGMPVLVRTGWEDDLDDCSGIEKRGNPFAAGTEAVVII